MTYIADGRQYVVVAAGGRDRLHSTMGDYVAAFALPGRGALSPDTASRQLAGNWRGEMHIGDARFGMKVTLGPGDNSFAASVRMDSVAITSPVTAIRSDGAVTVSFSIRYPTKHNCAGTVRTTLQLWNGGTLLEGGGTFDGACADRGHQEAAFVLRRP
jgi:hypothetical protein